MRVLTATSLSLLHLLRVQGFGIVPLSSSARGTRSLKVRHKSLDHQFAAFALVIVVVILVVALTSACCHRVVALF